MKKKNIPDFCTCAHLRKIKTKRVAAMTTERFCFYLPDERRVALQPRGTLLLFFFNLVNVHADVLLEDAGLFVK